jgi:hypothetical protein
MLTDGNYEYELTNRYVIMNGAKCRRFVFVRRQIGKDKWYRIPTAPSFGTLEEAEKRFAVFRLNNNLREG